MLKFVKFAELPVGDQDRAVTFYTQKLGMNVVQDVPYRGAWRWIELELPGAQTRIMLTQQELGADTDTPRLVFIVDDVDATYQELHRRGVAFAKEPMDAPWRRGQRFAQFRDSEGNGIVISSS